MNKFIMKKLIMKKLVITGYFNATLILSQTLLNKETWQIEIDLENVINSNFEKLLSDAEIGKISLDMDSLLEGKEIHKNGDDGSITITLEDCEEIEVFWQ